MTLNTIQPHNQPAARTDQSLMDAFIGIDLGTSGCRACAIDVQANQLAFQSVSLPPSQQKRPDESTQQPDDWWCAVQHTIKALVAEIPGYQPRALSVDGTSASLLLCDDAGKPVHPAMMYNDAQSTSSLAMIHQYAPIEQPVHSATASLAKLLYLHQQGITNKATHALHQAEWIAGCFTGIFNQGDENNALKLGYDPVKREWPDGLFSLLEASLIPIKFLPQIKPAGQWISTIQPETATQLQLPESLSIISGTTDSTAAAIAAGLQSPGDATTALGSTLVLKVLSNKPVFSVTHGIYSHRLFDQWLVGGASNTGGAVLKHFFTPELMAQMSHQLAPEKPTGLNYYPLLSPGERFPFNDPDFNPRLTPRTDDPLLFFQGLLEGISHIESLGYDKMQALGAPTPNRVFSTGGGAMNNAWTQIRQQQLGIPISSAHHTEAAYGAAKLALSGYLKKGEIIG